MRLKTGALVGLLGLMLALAGLYSLPVAQAGGVVSGACDEAALTAALSGGGLVTFNCGGPVTITLNSVKQINADTTIDGGGLVTLRAGGQNRLFQTSYQKSLTLKGLILRDANVTDGANAPGGAVVFGANQSNITLTNCQFIHNTFTASNAGSGDYGGAVYVLGATLTVDNTTFDGNVSNKSGGSALHTLASNVVIRNSTFTNNRSTTPGVGGAFYSDNVLNSNGFISVQSTTFQSNTAQGEGGAILNYMYLNNQSATYDHVNFVSNSVTADANGMAHGGALRVGNGRFNIQSSLFQANNATEQGGAIWTGETVNLTIAQSALVNNQAVGPTGHTGFGGGLAVNSSASSSFNIINTTFSNNQSGFMGGGMSLNTSGPVLILNSTIADNTAWWQGGGIQNANYNVTLRNSIIANNVANNGGNNWNIYHNCFPNNGKYTDGGHNLQYSALNNAASEACANGIAPGSDPKLAALASNGGPTLTRELQAGSPALNAFTGNGCPATDQRGISRPQSSACEIGAFEAAPPSLSLSYASPLAPINQPVALTFHLINPTNASLSGISFSDSLPAPLKVATTPGISNGCGGTAVAGAGTTAISLSGVSLGADASCNLVVNVVGNTVGLTINTPGVPSAAETGPGVAGSSTSLQLVAPTLSSGAVRPGGTLVLGVTGPGSQKTFDLKLTNTADAITTLTVGFAGGSFASAIGGPNGSEFAVSAASPTLSLPGGTSQTLNLSCQPGALGKRTATLGLTTNDPTLPTVTYSLVCLGGYPVTQTSDNGQGDTAGSLSYVLKNQANVPDSGVYFQLSSWTISFSQPLASRVPAGVTLDGGCSAGPGVILSGAAISSGNGDGLILGGKDVLIGLQVRDFPARQIVAQANATGNQFYCVGTASR